MEQSHSQEKLDTPVLLIIFSREDTTSRVIEALRKVKPTRLYIAADGPRSHKAGEADKCQATREAALKVDWDCEVKTLFREENVGCGLGPSTAMDWFFTHEEAGIILEDDIIPHPTFFYFCEELLLKYKDDQRIMQISGGNFQDGWKRDRAYSYYFSQHGSIWGWATWRRAWKHFEYHVPYFEEVKAKDYIKDFFFSHPATSYVLDKLEAAYLKKPEVSWWDYQWDFAKFLHSGLSIVPNNNLTENIGFGEGATHTITLESRFEGRYAEEMVFPLIHPPFIVRDTVSESRYFDRFYVGGTWQKTKIFMKNFVPKSLLKQPFS